jgi:hypothetical protein
MGGRWNPAILYQCFTQLFFLQNFFLLASFFKKRKILPLSF